MYSTQLRIEDTYSKANIPTWILEEINRDAVSTAKFKMINIAIQRYMDGNYYPSKALRVNQLKALTTSDISVQLYYVVLSIDNVEPIQGIATALGHNLGYSDLDAVKTGAELLAVCKDIGLYELLSSFDEANNHDTAVIKPNFTLDEDTRNKIHLTMYLPPMLVAPKEWTNNSDGGQLLHRSSCILGAGNSHGLYQSLDVLNKLQDIPWELNEEMLMEPELPKANLSSLDPDELRKIRQHNDRIRQSNLVYQFLLDNDNQFYFKWTFDKRGRMYSSGYDVNLQGSEYKKATIQFANKHKLTGV